MYVQHRDRSYPQAAGSDRACRHPTCSSTLRAKRTLVERGAVEVRLDVVHRRSRVRGRGALGPARVAVRPYVCDERAGDAGHVLLEGL